MYIKYVPNDVLFCFSNLRAPCVHLYCLGVLILKLQSQMKIMPVANASTPFVYKGV